MLKKFLTDNVNLFVVLAFFIALADFFNSKANSETGIPADLQMTLHLGIVACVAISILISFTLFKELFRDPAGNGISISFIDFSLENIERFMFIIPFFSIIMILFAYIYVTFNLETNIIVALIIYLISIPLYFQVAKTKIFKEHLYFGSFGIAIVSLITFAYFFTDPKNDLFFMPLRFFLSTFFTMSFLIFVVTLMRDIMRIIDKHF